ncbi:TGB1 [Garlic yellow virus]|nr:TGB1 [Garlic yellow virus]
MEVVSNVLNKFGFTRSLENSSGVKIVLGVPGCGKTSCIREIIQTDSRFIAFTFGVPDNKNVSGAYIRKAPLGDFELPSGAIVLVDEFQAGDWKALKPSFLFGDICQFDSDFLEVPRSHWYKTVTHRVNKDICVLLNKLGFQIESTVVGKLSIEGIYQGEPEGVIIAYCAKVQQLLRDHNLDFLDIENCRGRTFKSATLILEDHLILPGDRGKFYLCATRASSDLKILVPDAIEPTS